MSVVWIDHYVDGPVGKSPFILNGIPIIIDACFWSRPKDGLIAIEICEEEEVVDNADTPLSI